MHIMRNYAWISRILHKLNLAFNCISHEDFSWTLYDTAVAKSFSDVFKFEILALTFNGYMSWVRYLFLLCFSSLAYK